MTQPKKREGFLYGALMLSLSGILVKIIGIFFRIPLTNMVGSAVMAHYSSAYEVYNLMLSLATSGLPIGISAMISKSLALGKYRDVRTLIRSVAVIFVSAGALLTVLGMIFAMPIAEGMNSRETYSCIFNIMPAIVTMAAVSVFRGFFQGYNNMNPTAISNVIEAVTKLGVGYGLAYYRQANGYPPHEVVAGAILGVTMGTVASCLFLVLRYVFRKDEYRISVSQFMADVGTPRRKLLKEFFIVTLPIMLSSVTVHLFGLIDAAVVMNTLKNAFSLEFAQLNWGAYSNMSLTIFNLPSFLIINIGVSMVPSISAAYARRDESALRFTLNKALRYSSVLAFACAFGLMAVAQQTVDFIYSTQGTEIAGRLLQILSISLIAVGLTNVTGYVLQSIGKAYLSVLSVAVGAVVKTAATVIFTSIPSLNIYGAPLATNIAWPVMLVMNLLFLRRELGFSVRVADVFLKPLGCGVACFAAAFGVSWLLSGKIPDRVLLFLAILAGAVVYVALILLVKLVSFDEIRSLVGKKRRKS